MLACWIQGELCSSSDEIFDYLGIAKRKRTARKAASKGEDYSDYCRICNFQNQHSEINRKTTKKPRYDQTSVIKYAKRIKKWSIIQLIACSLDTKVNKDELLKPVHLECLLSRIALHSSCNSDWVKEFCNNTSGTSNCVIGLELVWLKNFIKNVNSLPGMKGNDLIMRIDGVMLYPGTYFNVDWLNEHLRRTLPEYVNNYIKNFTIAKKSGASMSWHRMLKNPYLFYNNFCGKFDDVINMYKLPTKKKDINDEIAKLLNKVGKEPKTDTFDRSPLQILFIVHIIHEKQLKNSTAVSLMNLELSLNNLIIEPNSRSFQQLIYSLEQRNKHFAKKTSTITREIIPFLNFLNDQKVETTEFKYKVMNFWIASMVLFMPYEEIPLLCYFLFKKDKMNNFTTWRVFRYSFLIRRLLIDNKNAYSDVSRIPKMQVQGCDRAAIGFCSYNELCKKILNSFSYLKKSTKTVEEATWNKDATSKTFNLLCQIYKEITEVCNKRSENRKIGMIKQNGAIKN